jgi:diaminopimelate decarboxylase
MAQFANEIAAPTAIASPSSTSAAASPREHPQGPVPPRASRPRPPSTATPTQSADGLAELDYPAGSEPTLVLETGRALVDEAGYLLTTVDRQQAPPRRQRGLVLDAGVNLLFTSFWYKHDVVPAQEFGGMLEPTVMYGPCA